MSHQELIGQGIQTLMTKNRWLWFHPCICFQQIRRTPRGNMNVKNRSVALSIFFCA